MKKYLQWGMISLIILGLCWGYAHINKMHCLYDEEVDPSNYTSVPMAENEDYIQSFVAQEECIDGFNIKISADGQTLEHSIFQYYVMDKGGEKLRSGEVSGGQLKSGKFNKLKFPRLEDANGKQLLFGCSIKNLEQGNTIALYEENSNLVLKYYMFRFDVETFIISAGFCLYIFAFMKLLFKLFRE